MDIGKDKTEMSDTTRWSHVRISPSTYVNIVGAQTVSRPLAKELRSIIVNEAVSSGTITLYDSESASGTLIGTITFPLTLLEGVGQLNYHCTLNSALTVVTTGNLDITVLYA